MSDIGKIASMLNAATGLDPGVMGVDTVRETVRARMAERQTPSLDEYVQILRRSPQALQQLIEGVVVPETWFFRDVEPFAFLARQARSRGTPGASGILRILSIPCSTGEEPYSIAMALLDAGLRPRQFRIDALDISGKAIAAARTGEFGRNSFRVDDLGFRERYFERLEEKWRLRQSVMETVQFTRGNLLDCPFLEAVEPYPVVFCRNLLIYLDAAARKRALHRLDGLVASPGLLFVGHTEVLQCRSERFTPVRHPRSFALSASGDPDVWQRQLARFCYGVRAAGSETSGGRAGGRPCAPAGRGGRRQESGPLLDRAMDLANRGDLAAAAKECEHFVARNGPSARAYFILGLVRDASGSTDLAEELFNKALYLDPEHYPALIHLALLARRKGDSASAEVFYRRARKARRTNERET